MSLPLDHPHIKHGSTEMTLRYASLAAPAIRTAYEEAMSKARARLVLPIAPIGQPIIPGRVEWLRAEMLKTRVAHGYCSRQLAAEACPLRQHLRAMRQLRHRPPSSSRSSRPSSRHHRAPRRRRRTRLAHRSRPPLTRHRQHSGPPATAHTSSRNRIQHLIPPPRAG